jgi:hypothetical protein
LPAPERVALLRARSLFLRKFFSRLNADVADPVFLVRVGREEIFGPVVSVMRAPDLDAAIMLTNRSRYGNTASLFTQSGAAARTFRERIQAGMLGINLGVPATRSWEPALRGDSGTLSCANPQRHSACNRARRPGAVRKQASAAPGQVVCSFPPRIPSWC